MKFKIVYADELYKVQKEMNALLIDKQERNMTGRTGKAHSVCLWISRIHMRVNSMRHRV